MTNLHIRATALFGCLLSGLTAQAGPVTFDFTGTGFVCTFASDASCASRYDGAFTGSVTIEVLASGPGGTDSYTNGNSLAYDYDGWAQADFLIQWGGNSFNPGTMPSQVASDNYVQLANDYLHADYVAIRENYSGSDGSTDFYSNAVFTRQTGDLSWLSELAFPDGLGFAPGPAAVNQIAFSNYSRSTAEGLPEVYAGYSGAFDLSSFSVQPANVPEPGTLALFVFGLAGLGLCRRRRAPQ